MFHRSERLFLRPIWPEDWQAIYSAINDEQIVRNLALAPWPYAESDARDFASLGFDVGNPRFLITTPNNSELVGCIGIDRVDNPKAVELGYWIARDHWGCGYATEAGHAALAIAALMGKSQANAGHFTDNPASGAVLKKLGFQRNGPIVQRSSKGRGGDVPTMEYTLRL